ncbi:sphingoid long-chain bases kinase 1-like [Hibiscus syriacus]|uniref:sphingoid long-chain bases kinase 1-like n=1 Tax=Hibiscus syriacus TaxID=106335 RepID=UPI001922188C|nr:sphingoid long-chain bases kinase 1-like [Hibiscus syriacus]
MYKIFDYGLKSDLRSRQSSRRLSLCSQIATHTSSIVFRRNVQKHKAFSKRSEGPITHNQTDQSKREDHRVDIGGGDEKSDLLGYAVYSGRFILVKRKNVPNNNNNKSSDVEQDSSTDIGNKQAVAAKLTSKALVWGSRVLSLDDVISVSYNVGVRHFTVYSYPLKKGACGFSGFIKPKRSRKDFRLLASSVEEAIQWVGGRTAYINCLPHPLVSSKKQASPEFFLMNTPPELVFRCKNPPKILVILNPRSGRGRSTKVFHGVVEPIFKLAGFKLEVIKTTSAGHAKKLASTVDISTCPDGIICVGGDGIINEALNSLLSRENQKEGISIPIGIIPAGSDNSLVWTVLGVRDPVSAAISIVKGGLTAIDVFAVEWIQTGVIHFGMTVSYYGFVSDVLELSEKYQKRFGPLRYFVAGFLKLLCLPKYNYEVEYLPAAKEDREGKISTDREVVDMSDLYTDVLRGSHTDGIPRAASLSSIDSMITPSRVSMGEMDRYSSTHASTEPSEYVRGLDPKTKWLSSGRSNVTAEPEVIHPQLPLSTTPNWPRTRSKSRTDKGWSGLTAEPDPSRCAWGNAATNDREDISSTLSDPGPIWDTEPKWDTEAIWHKETAIELPGPQKDVESGIKKEVAPRFEDKWIVTKGPFLGILVCNHACKTVQSSQVVAPKAEHDDNTMDVILVHGSGRLRLIRFFLLLQMGKHLLLPNSFYYKWQVKSVKIKAGKHKHNGCGIDGEFFPLNGEVVSSLLPEQCRLIGRFPGHHL